MSSTESKKRKLIFLWTYTEWGGAQMYMLTIIKQALEDWDVVVAIPKASRKDLVDFYRTYNIPIEFLDNHFDAKVEDSILGKLRRQFERIRAEAGIFSYLRKFDLREAVLHIEIAPWQSWILLASLSLRGANVFITLNSFRPEISRLRELIWRIRFAVVSRLPGLHIFASNRDTKECLKEWLSADCISKVGIGYSPIDRTQIEKVGSAHLNRSSLRNEHGIGESDFVVLAVGNFIDRKGRWTFLEAGKLITREAPNVRLVWLMPRPISAEDQRKVDSFGLGDRFVPVLSSSLGTDRESILRFFRVAEAFALPSFVEGLPIALLEAMALRLPSISTNVYAIPEAITDEVTGILIEAGDTAALAEAILRLMADPVLRRRLSDNGSQFAMENFDGLIMASTYLDHYGKCFET